MTSRATMPRKSSVAPGLRGVAVREREECLPADLEGAGEVPEDLQVGGCVRAVVVQIWEGPGEASWER